MGRTERGKVISVNVAGERGGPKKDVGTARLIEESGLEGDAHAGRWHRQVSLLAEESLDRMERSGTSSSPGSFGENLTTRGIKLISIPVGTRLMVGESVVLEITQVRKEKDDPTAVYYYEDGVKMPLDVVFARVVSGGVISRGDSIEATGDEEDG